MSSISNVSFVILFISINTLSICLSPHNNTLMHISITKYRLLIWIIGGLLIFFGGASIFGYCIFAITGTNSAIPLTNGMGAYFLGLMGAFPLPLGVALIRAKEHTRILLLIAAYGWVLNALIRLSLLFLPDTATFINPGHIAEICMFGGLALASLFIHPKASS